MQHEASNIVVHANGAERMGTINGQIMRLYKYHMVVGLWLAFVGLRQGPPAVWQDEDHIASSTHSSPG